MYVHKEVGGEVKTECAKEGEEGISAAKRYREQRQEDRITIF
jgi:hypothetical protein